MVAFRHRHRISSGVLFLAFLLATVAAAVSGEMPDDTIPAAVPRNDLTEATSTSRAQIDDKVVQTKAEQTVGLLEQEMEVLKDQTKMQIEMAQRKAEQDVAVVKKDMEALRDEMKLQIDKINDEAQHRTKKIQQESQEEISKTNSQAKRTADEALERSYEIERNAEQTAELALQRADSLVSDTQRNAQHKVDQIEENCMVTVNEAEADCAKMLHEQGEKNEGLALDASKREAALQATIDDQHTKTTSLKATTLTLANDLDEINNQLRYWVQLHDHQGLVNTTLVKMHSRAAIDKSLIVAAEKAMMGYTIIAKQTEFIRLKAETISQPHRETIRKLYREKLQETVDSKIIPFYQERIVPLQRKVYKEALIPIAIKCQKKEQELSKYLKTHAQKQFQRLCLLVQDQALIVKTFVLSDKIREKVSMPGFLIGMLEETAKDSTMLVSIVLKTIAVFAIYKLRYSILWLLLWLCFLPFRVLWRCCPLRLVFGGRKKNC